jgi:hypothetical protein
MLLCVGLLLRRKVGTNIRCSVSSGKEKAVVLLWGKNCRHIPFFERSSMDAYICCSVTVEGLCIPMYKYCSVMEEEAW